MLRDLIELRPRGVIQTVYALGRFVPDPVWFDFVGSFASKTLLHSGPGGVGMRYENIHLTSS